MLSVSPEILGQFLNNIQILKVKYKFEIFAPSVHLNKIVHDLLRFLFSVLFSDVKSVKRYLLCTFYLHKNFFVPEIGIIRGMLIDTRRIIVRMSTEIEESAPNFNQ